MGILSFQMWLSRHTHAQTRTHTHTPWCKRDYSWLFFISSAYVWVKEREKEWKNLQERSNSFFQSLFLMSHLEQSLFSPKCQWKVNGFLAELASLWMTYCFYSVLFSKLFSSHTNNYLIYMEGENTYVMYFRATCLVSYLIVYSAVYHLCLCS